MKLCTIITFDEVNGLDWIQSIQRALNYIETHLFDEGLDNNNVAKQAYSSSANFQRTFSIVTGVTIADYIRFRRLTLAGEELVKPTPRSSTLR